MISYIVAIIAVALIFDFINGFHDSANAIATIVGTRVLSPLAAVCWAAVFNFAALFVVGTGVAKTIYKGMVDPAIVTPSVILGALVGAIIWNLITWRFGLPSSSSHALLGGFAGSAVAKGGFASIIMSGWTMPLIFIVVSPVIGLVLGFALMTAVYWIFHKVTPHRVDATFRILQLVSSAAFSMSHGANDAQKTMGIIMGLLVASSGLFAGTPGVLGHLHVDPNGGIPFWVEASAYSMISLGTLFGGWRIVHTMGSRITKLRPVGGFCAETGGALSIMLATYLKIPVSTTHTITGAIVGVGATHRLSAVRWGVAGRIVWAWVLTMPAAFIMAMLAYGALRAVGAP